MNALDNLNKYDIILASNSPRRKELFAGLDIKFRVATIQGLKEVYPPDLSTNSIPEFLSKLKAEAYSKTILDNQLIVTADTLVINNNIALGKPKTENDARNMLKSLSEKKHDVITGVTILTKRKIKNFSVTTKVEFDTLTDDEIEYYINKYKPFDKAGAYGIQEWIGYIGVKSISGSFYNVMGLPVQRLYTELKQF